MGYYDKPVSRFDKSGADRKSNTEYNSDIDSAKNSNYNQLKESDPMVQKDGFLGVDDVDRMRRRKVR